MTSNSDVVKPYLFCQGLYVDTSYIDVATLSCLERDVVILTCHKQQVAILRHNPRAESEDESKINDVMIAIFRFLSEKKR